MSRSERNRYKGWVFSNTLWFLLGIAAGMLTHASPGWMALSIISGIGLIVGGVVLDWLVR
jgi:hypothetical protein